MGYPSNLSEASAGRCRLPPRPMRSSSRCEMPPSTCSWSKEQGLVVSWSGQPDTPDRYGSGSASRSAQDRFSSTTESKNLSIPYSIRLARVTVIIAATS